jgi:hypothetical protein
MIERRLLVREEAAYDRTPPSRSVSTSVHSKTRRAWFVGWSLSPRPYQTRGAEAPGESSAALPARLPGPRGPIPEARSSIG